MSSPLLFFWRASLAWLRHSITKLRPFLSPQPSVVQHQSANGFSASDDTKWPLQLETSQKDITFLYCIFYAINTLDKGVCSSSNPTRRDQNNVGIRSQNATWSSNGFSEPKCEKGEERTDYRSPHRPLSGYMHVVVAYFWKYRVSQQYLDDSFLKCCN